MIYTYGIIDSNNGIDKSLKGLQGACIYNIPCSDIGIVVSSLNGRVQDINPEQALNHEKIVEILMESFTILPMRFLTIFNNEKDVLSMAKSYYSDFKENLDRLRNKVEFGIKVIWPADAIRERIASIYAEGMDSPVASGDSPGKSFLNKKFAEYMIEKDFEEEANSYIEIVDGYFNNIAAEKKLQKLQSKNLLLNASYLVEKEKQGGFKEAFVRLKSAQGDLKYLFSGPWPPYNFIILTKRRHNG